MREYLDVLRELLQSPKWKNTRPGVRTTTLVGVTLRHDMSKGFPLLTTKKVFFKGVIEELLWFLRGETNIRPLQSRGVHIWDEWADSNGDLGPVYGKQWRNFGGVDQVQRLLTDLTVDPFSRRHIVSAWNVGELDDMQLAPCHLMYQCVVTPGEGQGKVLSMVVTQRSADFFLGVPFNIASYAALLTVLATVCGYTPGTLVWNSADCHLYENHVDAALEQLSREPRGLPALKVDLQPSQGVPRVGVLTGLSFSDFHLSGYDPYPTIIAPVAV